MLFQPSYACALLRLRSASFQANGRPPYGFARIEAKKRGGKSGAKDGREKRIRTSDPLLPKQMRYQAAPLPETGRNIG